MTFFPKIVWWLPIKSQEIRFQEVLKKINPRKKPRKKVLSLGKFELSNLSLRKKVLRKVVYKIILEAEKNVYKIKSRIGRTLFPKTF